MAKKLYEFPFVRGQDEGIDQRLLGELAPKGTLARAVNVRLRLDGRLASRRAYETVDMSSSTGSDVEVFDLADFQGRLVALGDSDGRGYPSDVYELVSSGAAQWVATDSDGDIRLGGATQLRDVGRLPAPENNTLAVDVAAANGFVCIVSSDAQSSYVHVFRADTDQRVLVERSVGPVFKPRVVAIGGVFYIAGLNNFATAISLRKFDPATDTATVALSTPFAAGDTIEAWDMTTDTLGASLVMVAARSTPATQLRIVSTAGSTTATITGPATTEDFISCWSDGTRAHIVDVPTATATIRISTYIIATTTLENGPTTLFSSGTTEMQAGMLQRDAAALRVVGQLDANNLTIAYQDVTVATHALGTANTSWRANHLTTKPLAAVEPGGTFGAVVGGRFIDPDTTNFLALLPNTPLAATEHYIGGASLVQLPHLATDASTGKAYWARVVADGDGDGIALASEVDFRSGGRQQMAAIGGHLYIAGGVVNVYDGRQVVESGFLDSPIITAVVAETSDGFLTPDGVYSLAVVWEQVDANGDLTQSAPSEVAQVTLGPSDNRITITFTSPHSIRRDSTNASFGRSTKGVVYISEADGTVLHRIAVTNMASSQGLGGTFGAIIRGPDSDIAEQGVIYTQGSRGALSGPLPFETALPSRYIWASKERLLLGGQPSASQAQESRPLFPGEPVEWSLDIGFFTRVRGQVTAVAILDEQRFVFTEREVFIVPGDGLDDNGIGEFGPAMKLPSDTGCIDWRSLVEVGDGLMFQGDADKVYLLPRGGGKPVWIGQPVRQTLASYPTIVAASYLVAEQCAYFACMSPEGDGRTLVYDTRAQTWFVDEPLEDEGYRSACAHDGLMHLVLADGTVVRQTVAEDLDFIPVTLETPDIYAAGPDGWAQYYGCSLQLEYLGDCVITLEFSTDGGRTFTTGTAYTLTAITPGTRVRRSWTFGPFQSESIRLRFTSAAVGGQASAGVAWIAYGVWAEPIEGMARTPADGQG